MRLHAGRAELVVALLGATPLRWTVPWAGGRWDLLDGYVDDAELASQDGVRNGIMAPFCNRVADGRYIFDGVAHDLLPGVPAGERTTYHGLVRTEPFVLVRLDEDDDAAEARLRCDALAGGTAVGYPFRVVVEVRYRLTARALDVEITGWNTGTTDAPFASGWHPYLRLPGAPTVDGLHLSVPAVREVVTDTHLVPLAGAAAYRDRPPVRWEPVGDRVVDRSFVPAPGPCVTVLRDPASGTAVTLTQQRGMVHVFTGDTLARDRRASIAVEPVEVLTDAFNRPDQTDAVRLRPGERRTFGFTLCT